MTDTPRKMVFGRTAMNTDLRYQEWWGGEQEYCSQVFALASHHCTSLDEIWLDDKLAWTSARGVIGEFVGYLVVQSYVQATTGSVFNAGWSRRWGAQATFAGCATLYLQFKVTGNGKKGKSPFTSSVTSRLSVIGKGAPLPDPRFDSTAGGSGALRVADQTTWNWASQGYEAGRNPALALLFYLIGWRIQNPSTGEWKLAVGRGVPIDRINLDSFITAANLCDEPVMRTNGASEPRYRCDGTFSEGDDPSQVIANFETCMNAKLRDSAGRFSLQVLHNDLATPVLDFTDDDVLGDFSWTAGNDLNDRRNVVRGRYTDPSALYQLADFPQIKLPALDGIDRIESLDLALVQSPGQAQRLAKQRVQRQQYEGEFRASFNARGWAVKDGDIVRLTFSALGFDRKLFRVSEGLIDPTGSVPLVLGEEHPSIYAWDREESPAVQAAAPNTFNPLLLPIIAAIDDAGQTADWPAIVGEGKPDDFANVTGDHTSKDTNAVNGRAAADIVAGMDVNALAILEQALRQDDFLEVVKAWTFAEGQPVSTGFLAFRNAQQNANLGFASASDFNSVFAKAPNGTGYTMNLQTVKAGNATFGDLLAGYDSNFSTQGAAISTQAGSIGSLFSSLSTTNGNLATTNTQLGTLSQNLSQTSALAGSVNSKVTALQQAFATDSGGAAKFLLAATVDANGKTYLSGISGSAGTTINELNFVSENFNFVRANGGTPVKLLSYNGTLNRWEFTVDVYAKRIVAGAVDTDQIAANALSASDQWSFNYNGSTVTTASISGSSYNTWYEFGPAGNKALLQATLPVSSRVFIRVYINASRTGSSDDTLTLRVRRTGPDGVNYLGLWPILTLNSILSILSFEWPDQYITQAGAYEYAIEMQRNSGGGQFALASATLQVAKR